MTGLGVKIMCTVGSSIVLPLSRSSFTDKGGGESIFIMDGDAFVRNLRLARDLTQLFRDIRGPVANVFFSSSGHLLG